MRGLHGLVLFCAAFNGVLANLRCTDVGRKYQHPDSCQKYIECTESGSYKVESCFFIKRFDVTSQECVWFWKVGCEKAVCFEGNQSPIPEKCDLFYECLGNSVGVRSCPSGTRFDPKSTNCTAGYDCSRTPECSEGFVKALKGECKAHLVCTGGAFARQECSEWKNFNPTSLECERTYKCQQQCSGVWRRPDPKDCQKYKECSSGKLTNGKCSLLHRFDPVDVECKWWWKVDCSKKPVASTSQVN